MEPPEDRETMSPFDGERSSAWVQLLQVLLGATGIFAVAFYAVGWLYWIGYFGYLDVPLGAIDLSLVDVASGAFPRFIPVVGTLAVFPLIIFAQRKLEQFRIAGGALIELAEDLEKRVADSVVILARLRQDVAEAGEDTSVADIQSRFEEVEVRQEREERELEALTTLTNDVGSPIPMRWLPDFLLGTPALVVFTALMVGIVFGLPFLTTYDSDGLKSAAVMPIRSGLTVIVSGAAFLLAYRVWQRRLGALSFVLVVTLIVGVPVFAWTDGTLSAFGAWNSNDRTNRFGSVVLYSELQLFDDWEQTEGALFASPELLLIRKAGDTYVVAADGSSDKVTVISSNTITHVDYLR